MLLFQVPATINRYLRDYQRDGVKFLYRHYVNNTGAILGDDMGLGKTVQVRRFEIILYIMVPISSKIKDM